MVVGQSFAQLERKLKAVEGEFDGTAGKARLARVGVKMRHHVDDAVRSTLGDQSMSGWRRGAPIAITGTSKPTGDGVLVSAGKASGPMRVLQSGRNQGNAAGFAGPGINRKTGTTSRTKAGNVRKARAFKARRWNGTTQGKGTWADAAARIARDAPGELEKEVAKAIGKHLGRG